MYRTANPGSPGGNEPDMGREMRPRREFTDRKTVFSTQYSVSCFVLRAKYLRISDYRHFPASPWLLLLVLLSGLRWNVIEHIGRVEAVWGRPGSTEGRFERPAPSLSTATQLFIVE